MFQRQLADQHRRGLEMDAGVLDTHQDGPGRAAPGDRQRQGEGGDDRVDHVADLAPEVLRLGHARPVVMGLVEVVPRHLVDPDREHRFEAGVDPFGDDAGDDQLVDVEGGGVAVVEDQRVAQGIGPQREGRIACQGVEQPFVELPGGVEIAADLVALGLRLAAVKDEGPGVLQVLHLGAVGFGGAVHDGLGGCGLISGRKAAGRFDCGGMLWQSICQAPPKINDRRASARVPGHAIHLPRRRRLSANNE